MADALQSLGDAFPQEQERVRELLSIYQSIPTGAFGALMLQGVLSRAEKAATNGDVVAMLRSFQELKGCQ